jgi:integrase
MARLPKPWYWKSRCGWFVTIDGTRHPLGPDRKQAHERFYRLLHQPRARAAAPQSIAAIIDMFLESTQKHRAPDTYEWYRYRLQRFVDRHPDLWIEDLRPYHVQEWADSYPKLSVTSRRNYLRTVKRCMSWALKQGYIERNPVASLELPAGGRKEILVTQAEYENILALCVDSSFRDLVTVTWETGCRPQELLRVEARHVDLEKCRWVFPPSEAKGQRAPRIVYLTETALVITRRMLLAHPTGKLFRNSHGVAWTPEAVNCAFERIRCRMGTAELRKRGEKIAAEAVAEFAKTLKPTRRTKGGEVPKTPAELRTEARAKLRSRRIKEIVKRYSLYSLRHAWATRALQSGLDGLTVAVLMGHSDPSTLARVYQHLAHDPTHLLNQARKAAS